MRAEHEAGPLAPAPSAMLLEPLRGLARAEGIEWELDGLYDDDGQPVPPIDSSGVTPAHWLRIALALERHYHDFDGFVVLHGTDTMAYSASALSFLLVNLAKPVVLTGSQLPLFSVRTDAQLNLVNALHIAGWKASGLPLVPEVTVCFGDVLLRGNRTRKTSTSAWQGFTSPNYPRLGSLGETIRIHHELVKKPPPAETAFYADRRLVDDVLDITLFPGLKASQLAALVERPELRGVVLRAYGSGNAPGDPELLDVIGRSAQAGKTYVVVSQCNEGRVDLSRYAASRALLERGVASGFDMTPEAALTKLMWLLARESPHDVRAQLHHDQRGEQSVGLQELRFPAGEGQERYEGSARPDSEVRTRLERALLRLEGWVADGPARVRFFLNASGVGPEIPATDVRCLGEAELNSHELTLDVTEGVRRLLVDQQPVHLSLVAPGRSFRFERLQLDLLSGS